MTRRCEECGRPLLKSDTRCFHCNTPIESDDSLGLSEREISSLDLPAILRHAAVLLGLSIVAILLLNRMGLGYQEYVPSTPDPSPPAGWRDYFSDNGFHIWLPNDWFIFTPKSPQWEKVTEELVLPLPYSYRVIPPSEIRTRLSLTSQSEKISDHHPPTIVVDFFEGVSSIDPQRLSQEKWYAGTLPLDHDERLSEVPRPSGGIAWIAEIIARQQAENDLIHCIVMLVQGKDGVFVITALADASVFLDHEETLWEILESFQSDQ